MWNIVFAQPDVKAIKKRIEDLISRDYLERDKDNANLFKYLAWCVILMTSQLKLLLQLLQIAKPGEWWWYLESQKISPS
jgi:hypothetical protein